MKTVYALLAFVFFQAVKGQRTPTISYISQEQIKDIGQTVEFHCSVQYAQDFPVLWTKINKDVANDQLALSHGSSLIIRDTRFALRYDDALSTFVLQIKDIQETDAGFYQCEVEFAPVITAPRPRLGQALQYDMDLECHVEAYPPPAIVWLKDDFQLSNNQHYSISHFATADQYTDTTIRVITIEKRQYGEYTCRAANKLGTAETKVELFETTVPVCPPACGQALYYGVGVVPVSSGLMIVLVLFITVVMRNFYTKY
ncbi:PREDICTED: lachesin-like [Habropoda laboriosa]|uniref:lachesin-like n=1 Tax=Habropoda laboriosa TaxID=597456 RepID=UPI00083D06B0|nr:PREDICTED: lachesin-like [Habropoda laboriosa]